MPGARSLSLSAKPSSVNAITWGIVAGLAVLLLEGPAQAFVRTRSASTNAPFFRNSPHAVLEVATPPDTLGIAPDDVRAAAQSAVDAWSYPAVSCTSLSLVLAPGFADSQTVAYDGHNRIVMRTGAWCRDPEAMTNCHDDSQVALTTVFSRNHPGALDDGLILEADIEVNDVDYQWAVIPDGPISGRDYENDYDLTSALTHETGHFIGLAHVCELDGDPVRYDNHGDVSPACTMLSADQVQVITGATMYPTMNPADVTLRSLSDDDVNAACSVYPATSAVVGACDVAPVRAPVSVVVLAGVSLALALVVAARRRRT